MRFLLPFLLAFSASAQNYVLVPTSTPTAIGSTTNELQVLPSLLKDPSNGKVFMFYQKGGAAMLSGPSWTILKTSTVTRLAANPQDWDLNSDTSNCSGAGIPSGCWAGDGTNGFGNGFGTGVTSTGALMVTYLVTVPDDTTAVGSYYRRSTDHGVTWSAPVAFTVTYPQTDYDSPSGQFISIPSGQATGACSGGCVIKIIRTTHSPGEDVLTSFDDGVTFTTEVAWAVGKSIYGWVDENAFLSVGGNKLIGFVRPGREGPTGNGPIPLGFFWSPDLTLAGLNSTCGLANDGIQNCVVPNQPQTLATDCPGPLVNNFTWPHIFTSPINAAFSTVVFGDRETCYPPPPGVQPLFSGFRLRALTFNTQQAYNSQTFDLPAQMLLDLIATSPTSPMNFGNSTYADSVPTTGNNVTVVYESPITTTCFGNPCEQIWSFNAKFQLVASSMTGTLSQGATIQ